jgi:hypothetical protein
MSRRAVAVLLAGILAMPGAAATNQIHYFAHGAELDAQGVIAPWYKRQNGQFDYRVRIAAETLKRYPWAGKDQAASPAPEFIYNGKWDLDFEGKILPLPQTNHNNGDVGQRNAFVLSGLIDYYRYSGDAAVLTAITASADYLIDHCQTPESHGWPKMLISVPTMGKAYGDCRLGTSDELKDNEGKIQLDIAAQVAVELVRAYQLTGNVRWFDAAKHWADLLAQNRRRIPGAAPWGRYANNASGNGMNGIQTGGVAVILTFFDELIRTGYSGKNKEIIEARDAGRAYLRDVLLRNWIVYDTWGRDFWDWEAPVQDRHITERACVYMMDHKDVFPNWKTDVRNILTLFMNHNGVSPESNGDVYSGAWAYPESSSCCGRSLWYVTNAISSVFARYATEAGDEWAREIARRSQILGTYDILPDGHSFDLIDGGAFVSRNWFKNAQPKALKDTLRTIEWLPELAAPARENHLVHAASTAKDIRYEKGRVSYETYHSKNDSPDVLRLAFVPSSITADGKPLTLRQDLTENGYTVKTLPSGDAIVAIRHDGAPKIVITGDDPQTSVPASQLEFSGEWNTTAATGDIPSARNTTKRTASMSFAFTGNQVRLVGRVQETGGLADAYVDDMKQLVPVDFYGGKRLSGRILYYRNGLVNGPHTLRIVARGARNPLSKGDDVTIEGVQFSNAAADASFGEGGGPKGVQRLVFGYTGRSDYVDSQGNSWKPGMEFVARTGRGTDVVAKTWWTMRQAIFVQQTPDQELYRYGVHWTDFTVNLTVGPGSYYAHLKFAETQYSEPGQRAISIEINGERVVDGFDVLKTAGAPQSAVDLVFDKIEPANGIIAIRLKGDKINQQQVEAMIQAIEIGPGDGGKGATPKTIR